MLIKLRPLWMYLVTKRKKKCLCEGISKKTCKITHFLQDFLKPDSRNILQALQFGDTSCR